ncbi:MAG: HrgA protein [Bacteroidetes bacterium]|nr:HrgA protein [Bacteroidota bacterium]
MTFWDVIKKTLEKVGLPLTPKEIWDKANELGTIGSFKTSGKTPWATIGAYCYTDIINKGDKSLVIQVSERPAKFFLRDKFTSLKFEQLSKEIDLQKSPETKFKERDLHPLLATFAFSDTHFKANLKTIFHENSKRKQKGENEWLHPDVVGVYFPSKDFKPETLEMQKHLSINAIKIFSFEVKVNVNFNNLREYYFQAVSNSSWANEGYLVAYKVDDEPSLRDELRRLNNAFGIGIIELNAENVAESEIIFPAKFKIELDWSTIDRLVSENKNFKSFLEIISADRRVKQVESEFDKVLDFEEIKKHLKEKSILK